MPEVQKKDVLRAETADVRPFARLLRGVGFSHRATVKVTPAGFIVQVDEGRTMSAVAYIGSAIFDTYELNIPHKPSKKSLAMDPANKRGRRRSTDLDDETAGEGMQRDEDDEEDDPFVEGSGGPAARSRGLSGNGGDSDEDDEEEEEDEEENFEVNLHNLISCLNIYGNAGTSTASAHQMANLGAAGGGEDREGGGRRHGRGRAWAGGGTADDVDGVDEGMGTGRQGEDGSRNGAGGKGKKEPQGTTTCHITWKGPGWPLVLMLKDQDPKSPTTVCSLDLLEPEEQLRDEFDDTDLAFDIIMKSAWLREALSDLDSSCAKITIIGGPPADEDEDGMNGGPGEARTKMGTFRLEGEGNFGRTELDYPNEREIMDAFACPTEFTISYSFQTFMFCQKALHSSLKISLRIDHQGLCSLRMMMPTTYVGGRKLERVEAGVVEFKFKPLEEEEAEG